MNSINRRRISWPLALATCLMVSSAQVGQAQSGFRDTTSIQPPPTALVAADNCCPSGLAKVQLIVPVRIAQQISYGANLAQIWNDLLAKQQAEVRKKLGSGALALVYPLLMRANTTSPFQPRPRRCDASSNNIDQNVLCRSSLFVSADPQSKLLTISFRVFGNRLQTPFTRGFVQCGTFDLELRMVFTASKEIVLQSSEARSSNYMPTGACAVSGLDRFNSEIFVDAGIGLKLAEYINVRLRRVASEHGIDALTPGVESQDSKMLVFEITPARRAVPIGDSQ